MTFDGVLSHENVENAEPLMPMGINVLVVDSDSTCLTIAAKMLRTFGYRVVTAKRAVDALCILREREDELNLILTESRLPDMDTYELLETLAQITCLPIISDNNEKAMLGCLFKGASLYLVKPITMNDVKNLWQFSYMKERKAVIEVAGMRKTHGAYLEDKNAESLALGCHSFSESDERQVTRCNTRKETEGTGEDGEKNDGDDNSSMSKKVKTTWSNELHGRFLKAIGLLGIDDADPMKILQHMKVPWLTIEHVSSHLQEYRLLLKHDQDAWKMTMMGDSYLPSHTSSQGHVSVSQAMKPRFVTTTTSKPGLVCQIQQHIPMPSEPGLAHFDPNFEDAKLDPHSKQGNRSEYDSLQEKTFVSNVGNPVVENVPNGQTFMGNLSEQQQFFTEQQASPPELKLKQYGNKDFEADNADVLELLETRKEEAELFKDDNLKELWKFLDDH